MKKAVSSADAVDRISELPEGIIHGILARLESHESAARTSILSKRWLRLWSTFPFVEFKRDYGREEIQSKFHSFAAATSKRLLAAVPPLPLDSFTIKLRLPGDCDQTRQSLHQLLSSVAGGRSSPIKVVVEYNKDISPSIEGMLLTCRRTKFLDLIGFDLSKLHNFKTCLDNLQELSLEHIQVSRQSFPSCLARLEKLKLVCILGIDSLDISASNFPSLVSLDFEGYATDLQQLQLSSDTVLRTLRFLGECELLKLVSAPSVKAVHFSPVGGELSHSELENLISKFPSLESLYFNALCISGTSKLRVSSRTLRELTLIHLGSKMEFEIDTPNLATLTIDTSSLKINSTVVNVPPTCRCVFACGIPRGRRITTSWFIELRKCLAALATRFRQLVFKLDISFLIKVMKLDLSKVGHECAPLAVRHLLMATDLRNPLQEAHKTGLFDGLLWTVHPKALSVAMSSSDSSLSSYISEQIQMKNLKKCCSNGKCWRHQFKGAKITSVTVDDVSTVDESVISQPSIDMVFLITRVRYEYIC